MQKRTPKHVREWMWKGEHSRPPKGGGFYHNHPNHSWHELNNPRQSSSMQKWASKPTGLAAPKPQTYGHAQWPIPRHDKVTLQGMKEVINAIIQAWFMDWNSMENDPNSLKHPNSSMLMTRILKAYKPKCKEATLNMANMIKPAPNSPWAWKDKAKIFMKLGYNTQESWPKCMAHF